LIMPDLSSFAPRRYHAPGSLTISVRPASNGRRIS
jgi:hypothetical protein